MLLVGSTDLSGYELFVGVDQVVVVLHSKDSLISRLYLEVAVPGSGLGVFDIESSQAGLPEVGFQDLSSLAVVDSSKLEAYTELR